MTLQTLTLPLAKYRAADDRWEDLELQIDANLIVDGGTTFINGIGRLTATEIVLTLSDTVSAQSSGLYTFADDEFTAAVEMNAFAFTFTKADGTKLVMGGPNAADAVQVDTSNIYFWRPSNNAAAQAFFSDVDGAVTLLISDEGTPEQPAVPTVDQVDSTTLSIVYAATGSGASVLDFNLRYRVAGETNWTPLTDVGVSPHSQSGLTPNTLYEWQVQAVGAHTTSLWSPTGSGSTQLAPAAPLVPAAPTVAATGSRSQQVTFTGRTSGWPATSLDLHYRAAGVETWSDPIVGATSPHDQTGLTPSTLYEWQARAVGQHGTSDWSATGSASTDGLPPPDIPAAPVVTQIDNDSLRVTFAANDDGETTNSLDLRFRIDGALAWDTRIGVTSPYTVDGLTADTLYEFEARGVGNAGPSDWSDPGTGRTADAPAPDAPPAPHINAEGPTVQILTFEGASTGTAVAIFNLRFRITGGAWTNRLGATSPHREKGLDANTFYEWEVQGVGANGLASIWGASVSASTAAPSRPHRTLNPYVQSINHEAQIVSFSPAATGDEATFFNLRFREAGTAIWNQIDRVSSPYGHRGLLPDTVYQWQVQAVNSAGESLWSLSSRERTPEKFDVTGHLDLLIGQYDESARLRSWIKGMLQLRQDQLLEPLLRLEVFSMIDLAEGVWLDRIGERLGLPRPTLASYRFFGFRQGNDRGTFDEAPFHEIEAATLRTPVDDIWYRSLLKGRGIALRSGCSITDIEAVCDVVFSGDGWVLEDTANRAITVTVTERRGGFIELVRDIGLIPKPAGVSLTIVEA